MGCCFSSKYTSSSTPTQKQQSLTPLPNSKTEENRAPPPSLEELETVKEVLSSETPKPIKKTPLPKLDEDHRQNQEINEKSVRIEKKIKNEKDLVRKDEIYEQEESEVCSFSETVSTTTFNNDDDGEHEVEQRVTKRHTPPKLPARNWADLGPKQDRVVGRSPTRRSDMSPVKRNNVGFGGGSVRFVQSKESGSGPVGRRGGFRSDPNRRDPGESSGRRSRSPATNRSVMGRSPSAKRASQSPGRIRKSGPVEEGSVKDGSNTNTNGSSSTTNESLENPLVSLECFIFL